MELRVNLKENSYSIVLGNNLIKNIDKYYSLNSKVLVVTDSNIPLLINVKKDINILLKKAKSLRILIII